jgi:hypothetical protein
MERTHCLCELFFKRGGLETQDVAASYENALTRSVDFGFPSKIGRERIGLRDHATETGA